MTPQDTMRLALEALIWECGSEPALYAQKTAEAIEALRSALAQQDQDESDSLTIAYLSGYDKGKKDALAQQDELGNASKAEQLLASHDHALRAEFQRMKAALSQQGEQQPVAWCALSLDGKRIAFFDGKPVIMVGPVGNDCHQTPLYAGAAPAAQPFRPVEQGCPNCINTLFVGSKCKNCGLEFGGIEP